MIGCRGRAVVGSVFAAVSILVMVAPATADPSPSSSTTCWQKRAFYQARNPGLKETLGSGTRYSVPCVLDAYVAIERATAEFGVREFTDALVRIAACESLLQPTIIGRADPADVGLFQWNEKPPRYWWTTARNGFNDWQRRLAAISHGAYAPRFATDDRLDPYNSARVAAWEIRAFPHAWHMAWRCQGMYDPSLRRLR